MDVNERLLAAVLGTHGDRGRAAASAGIPYDEAIARFGSDKPDLRFGLELVDVTEKLAATEFNAFRGRRRLGRCGEGA